MTYMIILNQNEGELLEKIYFSEKQANNFVNRAKENTNWRELPITKRLHNKVCKYAMDEDRHSYNFTVAVFDTDSNILYIYELDT